MTKREVRIPDHVYQNPDSVFYMSADDIHQLLGETNGVVLVKGILYKIKWLNDKPGYPRRVWLERKF